VSGTWDLEMNWSSDARSTGTCEFRQDGDKLTGTCGGDDRFPISGQVQNNELRWAFEVKQEGSQGRMEFAGELDAQGTTIKGSCSIVGGQGGTFTMKKKQS
jgi:hypothetical protein